MWPWMAWSTLYKPCWPETQRYACLCLGSTRIKGLHHHYRPTVCTLDNSAYVALFSRGNKLTAVLNMYRIFCSLLLFPKQYDITTIPSLHSSYIVSK